MPCGQQFLDDREALVNVDSLLFEANLKLYEQFIFDGHS